MRYKLVLISALLIILYGCRADMELWVNNSGGGTGKIMVYGMIMSSADEIRSSLEGKGVPVVSVNEKGPGTFEIRIQWSDPRKIGKREELQNGLILLDLGKDAADLGSCTLHVEGNIVREQTTGTLKDPATAYFPQGSQQVRLVYKPRKPLEFPITYAVIAIGILGIVVLAVVLKVQSNKKKQQVDIQKVVPESAGENEILKGVAYCSNCGTKIIPEHKFCINCGNKIDNNNN
jgi:uncharacterized OB-fold protein